MSDAPQPTKFPENAYRELKPGEKYVPMVPPTMRVPELTRRMFVFGLIMNIVFSVAATFLALKAGQGIETAIPISILAVGLSGFLLKAGGRASSILENMYALSISTTSGYVAGGTCFTMPAIYILKLNSNLEMSNLALFLQITLVPFLGAILGALFLIPFRRYFVKDMHGKLPFPEATATNEILVTGASGSITQAWILIYSFVLSAIYTFAATALKLFSDTFTTGVVKLESAGREAQALAFGASGVFATLTTKVKAVFSMGAGAYYLGLGFIIGPRYASIICAGSFLSCFAIIPLMSGMNLTQLRDLNPACTAHSGEAEEAARFTLPMTFDAALNSFDEEKTPAVPEAVTAGRAQATTSFKDHEIELSEDAKFILCETDRVWKILDGDETYALTLSGTDIAVTTEEKEEALFTLPATFTATLAAVLPEQEAHRLQIRKAFAAQEIELIDNATFGARELGRVWEVGNGRKNYLLTLGTEQIDATVIDKQEPGFTLPVTLAAALDAALSPQDRTRSEIGIAFAAAAHPFEKAGVEITVEPEGKWILKDKKQTYELRTLEEQAGIAVFARKASADEIFGNIPKNIGIGAIFTAGLISILKMMGVIVTALRQALGSLFRKGTGAATDRTDEDISYAWVFMLGIAVVAIMAVFFRTVVFAGMDNATWLTFISVVLALVITFLFTTVSAWAIAMISVTPISGMTVTTIIITAVLMIASGLEKGDRGMLAVLLVGGVVCTGLSMAGGLITNFKMAYWLGASPKRVTWNALFGSLISAVFVCGTIMVLAYNPGYTSGDLAAPQANMMASALESFLGTGAVPWLLYGVGVMIALTVQLIGIPPLAFGLGMYLPMYINTPILLGAFVSTLVKKSTKDPKLSKARSNKGILLASGLIAGGAIMEVLISFTTSLDDLVFGKVVMPFLDLGGRMAGATDESAVALARTQNWLGLILFLALCVFVYFDCRRAKPELAEGGELG